MHVLSMAESTADMIIAATFSMGHRYCNTKILHQFIRQKYTFSHKNIYIAI